MRALKFGLMPDLTKYWRDGGFRFVQLEMPNLPSPGHDF